MKPPVFDYLAPASVDEALKIVYVDYPVKGGPAGRPGVGEMDKNGMVWMDSWKELL